MPGASGRSTSAWPHRRVVVPKSKQRIGLDCTPVKVAIGTSTCGVPDAADGVAERVSRDVIAARR